MQRRTYFALVVTVAVLGSVHAQDRPKDLPKPDDKPGAAGKPIKVFILMGQSNMVGMGDIGPETTKGTLPYTIGMWKQTEPIEVFLDKGQNTLNFEILGGGRAVIKDFVLTPVK